MAEKNDYTAPLIGVGVLVGLYFFGKPLLSIFQTLASLVSGVGGIAGKVISGVDTAISVPGQVYGALTKEGESLGNAAITSTDLTADQQTANEMLRWAPAEMKKVNPTYFVRACVERALLNPSSVPGLTQRYIDLYTGYYPGHPILRGTVIVPLTTPTGVRSMPSDPDGWLRASFPTLYAECSKGVL